MNRRRTLMLALPLTAAAVVLLFGLRIRAQCLRGESVYWLAALWPPAAILTIVAAVAMDTLGAGPKGGAGAQRLRRPAGRRNGARRARAQRT